MQLCDRALASGVGMEAGLAPLYAAAMLLLCARQSEWPGWGRGGFEGCGQCSACRACHARKPGCSPACPLPSHNPPCARTSFHSTPAAGEAGQLLEQEAPLAQLIGLPLSTVRAPRAA